VRQAVDSTGAGASAGVAPAGRAARKRRRGQKRRPQLRRLDVIFAGIRFELFFERLDVEKSRAERFVERRFEAPPPPWREKFAEAVFVHGAQVSERAAPLRNRRPSRRDFLR